MSATTPHARGSLSWLTGPAVPALLATLGCLPLLFVHFQQLWSREHYQYFPWVILAALLLYRIRQTDPDRVYVRNHPRLAALAFAASLVLATWSVLRISPLMCCAAWLLGLLSYVLLSPLNTWSQWGLLLLILRLPQGRDAWLIQWLQKITTGTASSVLDKLKIGHVQDGNILTFPDRQLLVEEACSGVVSLFTIITTAAIMGAFLRRSFVHTLLLMTVGAFWAGAANILRVVAMAFSIEKMGIDLTSGLPHDILGLAIFCVTLVTLFSSDGLIRFLFGPIQLEESSGSEAMEENQLVRIWNGMFWPRHERPLGLISDRTPLTNQKSGTLGVPLTAAVGAGFLAIGLLQAWGGIGPFTAGLAVSPSIEGLSKDSLPEQLAGWTQTEFRRVERNASSEFGHQSRQWTYRRGYFTVVLSVDYPFPEWHDLDVCYRGVGWKLDGKQRLKDGSTALVCPLRKDPQSAWLLYDLFDKQGAPYAAPAGQRIHPRWRRMLSGDASRWSLPSYYQVQALADISNMKTFPAHPSEELQQLFIEFRDHIREQAVSGGEQGPR